MSSPVRFKVVSIFIAFVVVIGAFSANVMAGESTDESFNAVLSIGKLRKSSNDTITPVDFGARWGSEDKDLVLGSDGVIRPLDAQTVDTMVTGSIPKTEQTAPRYADISNSQNVVKSVFTGDAFAPECGPSPLSETQIKQLVTETAAEIGVDKDFALAIVKVESDFDRIRNSPKGARGPMQLMQGTAVEFGVQNICDPQENIRGGMAYLSQLFHTYSNPLIVAAAYNAGASRIQEYGGIPPFAETLNYVAKVVNYQLGLPVIRKSSIPHTNDVVGPSSTIMTDAQSPAAPPTPSFLSGVSRPTKGQWVAGVLQF